MSHHYSGPDYGLPHGDARLDLTDLYVFPKPEDAGKSILIMNVHPSAGVNPSGATTAEPSSTDAIYEFTIDTNGDAVADGGFIETGPDLTRDDLAAARWPLERSPYLLDTSRPGVFTVSDVRCGNVKRVASAVGEGSIAISFIHRVLADQEEGV